MRHLIRIAALLWALTECVAAQVLAPPSQPVAPVPAPLKIGFVYVGPVGDAGWTYQHDLARKAVLEAFGDRVTTTYVEQVSEFDDGRVFQALAEQGHELIFATVFGYTKQVEQTAAAYPRVKFEQSDGYKTASNVRNYAARTYESAYLAGMLAGGTTRSNRLGVVASIPIPEIVSVINAYTLGARAVNPKVVTNVEWVMKWFDPSGEAQAAEKLFKRGVDVMFQTTDSSAVLQVAERRGKRAIGWDSDMSAYGPHAHLASTTLNWAPYYIASVNAVLNRTWTTGSTWWGVSQGAVDLSHLAPDVPVQLVERINAARIGLAKGTLEIWRGPLWNNAGKQVLGRDAVPSDWQIAQMEYLVRGVEGVLPRP